MAIASVPGLVEALRQTRLLEPAQLDELIRRLLPRFREPRALARELMERGWLTPYQVNQVLQGRATDLILGNYVLLERLGEGGMGSVFKARQRSLDRIVALKLIRKDRLTNPEALRRFHREIHAAAQLSHANIVTAFDADQAGDLHFLVMEFVEGISLARMVEQHGPLPVAQACEYIRQAALGLQHAHDKGMVHRDIKPSNLLVTRAGPQAAELGQVKILDMGLALLRHEEDELPKVPLNQPVSSADGSATLTRHGAIVGTPDFIAPEQAIDSHHADIRADLYSLGCTFYLLLTGRPPFPGGTTLEKLFKHRLEEPAPLEQLRPEVPAAIAGIIRRLMAKKPEDRYQTPQQLADALAALQSKGLPSAGAVGMPTSASRVSSPESAFVYMATSDTAEALDSPRRLRLAAEQRRWWRLNLAGGAVLLLLLGLLALLILRQSGGRAPSSAADDPLRAELDLLLVSLDNPATDRAQLRQQLLAFQLQYPGSAAAVRAAGALMRLPSPLDQLDPSQLPAEELIAGLPPPVELVAVLGESRLRHWREVRAVAYQPDGKILASAGDDGMIRLWNPANGQPLRVLNAGFVVHALAFSGNGSLLAAGGYGGGLQVWDPATGKQLRTLGGHKRPVFAVAFAPDGQTMASGGGDSLVKLWGPGGKLLRTFGEHAGAVQALAFSPDGQVLVSGGSDGVLKRWDVDTGKELQSIAAHKQGVTAVSFSPDGQLLASGGGDGMARLWQPNSGKELHSLNVRGSGISGLAFSPDGQVLATSAVEAAMIQLWDVETGALLHSLGGHWRGTRALAFRPDGQQLASGGLDHAVQLWNFAKSKASPTTMASHGAGTAVAFSRDGRLIAVGTGDGSLCLWEAPTRRLVRTLPGGRGHIVGLAFGFESGSLVSGSYDGTVRITTPESGKELRSLGLPRMHLNALALRADGQVLATAAENALLALWDVTTGRELRALTGHAGAVTAAAFSPDGRLLASGGIGGSVKVWEAATGKELHTHAAHKQAVRALAFAPDGHILASAGYDAAIHLWEVETGRRLQTLSGHTGPVNSLAFRGDGQLLVSAGAEGTVRLWDPMPGKMKLLLPLGPSLGTIHDVAFSSDGRYLATANGNGTAFILRLAPPPEQ